MIEMNYYGQREFASDESPQTQQANDQVFSLQTIKQWIVNYERSWSDYQIKEEGLHAWRDNSLIDWFKFPSGFISNPESKQEAP